MSLKKICAFIILVPLAVIMVAFIIANRHFVTLNLGIFSLFSGRAEEGYSLTAPLFVWLFVFLFLGFAAGGLAMLPKLCRVQKNRHRLEAENARLHQEVLAKKPHAVKDYSDEITI
ncbi:LapA family protein [Candidatus Tokpelaia sp.]|uniref:LapA family protein n=1 Tax=Candidatus Tokpelaia sp. TaxID=2233777 RepID=UPI0016816C68|nr:LapA family protein [Candidatus Tokpelaia sp.]